MTQEGSPVPQIKEIGPAHGAQGVDGTESVSHPSRKRPGSRRHARASRSGADGRGGRERAGSHAAGRRGAHAQSRTSPGGAGDPGFQARQRGERGGGREEGGRGGRSARAAAPDGSGLGGCCSAERPGPAGAGSSMCRGSPAAAAPLQQRRQQRPPWPSPARSSPASCKVRGCGGLRDAPSRSIPDPVRSSPRCTPAPVPPPSPRPMHSDSKAAPGPCTLARGIAVPEHPPLPASPHPVRTFQSQSRPTRSSVTGAVPWRSLGLPLIALAHPSATRPVSPPESPRFPAGRGPARPAGPRELPLVLAASWLSTLPPPGPAPELALRAPPAARQLPGQWGKKGVREEGPTGAETKSRVSAAPLPQPPS